MALFLLIIVAFDLSFLVRYITRFTEESFAVLISLIFIYEAFSKVAEIWTTHPVHTWNDGDGDGENRLCFCVRPTHEEQTLNETLHNITSVVGNFTGAVGW